MTDFYVDDECEHEEIEYVVDLEDGEYQMCLECGEEFDL